MQNLKINYNLCNGFKNRMKMEKTMKRIKVWRNGEVEWLAGVFKCTTRTIYNALAGKRGQNSIKIRTLALERGATEEP